MGVDTLVWMFFYAKMRRLFVKIKLVNVKKEQYKLATADKIKQSSDIVSVKVVGEGYQSSGKAHALVFTNLHGMAFARLKKVFPLANINNVLQRRIYSEFRIICAECIVKKYECRRDRVEYDCLKDADKRCTEWFENNIKLETQTLTNVLNIKVDDGQIGTSSV